MYEVACHRVLQAHIKGFKTNASNCTWKQCLLAEDSFTSTPPRLRPPPADYLTSSSVLDADLAPVLSRDQETLVRRSSTQCNLRSDSKRHNAIYAKLSQTTHISPCGCLPVKPQKESSVFLQKTNVGHGDSGTDTPDRSDSFLVIFLSHLLCK